MKSMRRAPGSAATLDRSAGVPFSMPAVAVLLYAFTLLFAQGCGQDPCDELNPLHCLLPFPSDRYLAEDPTTVTGYRLKYEPEAIPENFLGQPVDPAPFERMDGVSPGTQIITLFTRPPDLADAARQESIDLSLDHDSPTVLLDLETGERIPHWTELDARAQSDDEKLLFIRPATRLLEDRAYGVAIRNLLDVDGLPLEVSDAFAALRDDMPSGMPLIERRRPGFEVLFAALEGAGMVRGELQSAWWFHTASGDAIRGDLLAMREDALARLGDEGIGCTITRVEDNYKGQIWRYVEGTFTVPLYMDSPDPPARFVRGPDGRPEFQGYYEVPFVADIPATLAQAPGGPVAGPLVTFGHGLLGTAKGYIDSDDMRALSNRFGLIIAGTDWDGMSQEDIVTLGVLLLDANGFPNMTERLQQGMINQIALTRTLAGVGRFLPELGSEGVPLIDPEALYYVGGSQGGIFGGTLLTLSPDIERGVLFVGGANYSFILDRSIAFDPYFGILELGYPDRTDRAVLIAAAQHLWDSSDPVSYLPFTEEGLPGIGPKRFAYVVAQNDAQVPNLSADYAMRMAGVPVVSGSVREPWGLDVRTAPFRGSGYVAVDLGDPEVPYGCEAPPIDAGGHGNVPYTETSLLIAESFLLQDGTMIMPCEGLCDPD